MTEPGDATPPRQPRLTRRGRWVLAIALSVALVAVVAVVGYGLMLVGSFNGLRRSDALQGKSGAPTKDLNILLLGLDSRLDVNGNPLPDKIYEAMHTGDETGGGMNANVLMYIHMPADGSRAVAISIPRDDYVEFPGCPDNVCHGKIKEAYGHAYNAEAKRLAKQKQAGAHQQARDAGRRAEVQTVEKFLGVQIDHFVEVTMVAFYQIAQVVQPITVCLKQDTVDSYSGANFKAGVQQISAEQAVAFVRQRRDTARPLTLQFTDLDRSRRQQAFIVSLLTQLKKASTLTDPGKLNGLINVAKQNTAIDSGLDAITLAKLALTLEGGKLKFYTLPVEKFGTDPYGSAINVVDVPKIQEIVAELLHPPASATAPSAGVPTAAQTPIGNGVIVDIVNASGRNGLAAAVTKALLPFGFRAGQASTAAGVQETSAVEYAPGGETQAKRLAAYLGISTTRQAAGLAGIIRLTLGKDFNPPAGATPESGSSPTSTGIPTVAATAGGVGPAPNVLSELTGGGVPCVK